MAVVVVPVLVLVPDAIGLFIITLVAFKLHQVQVNIIIFRFRLGTDYNSRDQHQQNVKVLRSITGIGRVLFYCRTII